MPFTHTRRGLARLNRTSKLARRENVGEAADNAERPRSLGPACAAARRQGPRTAANCTGSSNPVVFFCDIKDLLAVQAVSSEPVSGDFPVKQGIYREISGIWPANRYFIWSKPLGSLVLFAKFPKLDNREFSKPNREIFARSREIKIPAPWPVFPHGWLPKAVLFHKVGDHL